MTKLQLDKARRQYLGQLIVASDNREQLALSTAHEYLYNYLQNPSAPSPVISHLDEINAITPQDIISAAKIIAPSNLSTLTFK